MLAFGFCGVFISQFVCLLVVCSSVLCDVNCLAAAGADQSSGSGDKVPPPRPPPPRVQQPAEGWFLVVSQALPRLYFAGFVYVDNGVHWLYVKLTRALMLLTGCPVCKNSEPEI